MTSGLSPWASPHSYIGPRFLSSINTGTVPVDKEQNARSVREETAELASCLLSDGQAQPSPTFLQRARSSHHHGVGSDVSDDASTGEQARNRAAIVEVPEPPSPDAQDPESEAPAGPSVRANLLKGSPPRSIAQDHPHGSDSGEVGDNDQTWVGQQLDIHHTDAASEQTPLLSRVASGGRRSYTGDLEGQQMSQTKRPWISGLVEAGHKIEERMTHGVALAVNHRRWDRKALWHGAVVMPVFCLPAMAVGLLLNMLDALSYGLSVCF